MLEYEFKRILNKEQYDFLTKPELLKKFKNTDRRVHVNYYYDTPEDEFNERGVTIRVRQVKEKLFYTVKKHNRNGCFCKSSELELKNVSKLNGLPEELRYEDRIVKLKGTLTTHRIFIPMEEGVTVMVDCNYYLGSLDYELEIEFENGHDADAIKCMSEIEYIFSKINIPFYNKNEKCLSKSERFFKELDKLKIKEYAKEQYRNSVDSHYYVFEQNKKIVINSKIEKSLPTEQRLAIFLYNKMYRQSVSEMNKWIDESPDFIHNWDGEVHKKYLNMALEFLGGELK